MYVEFGLTTDDAVAISVLGSGLAELRFGAAGVAVQLDDETMRELATRSSAALDEMNRRCAEEQRQSLTG
ncbi:MAG TPA: hypothetical protein VGP26_16155 [Actinophytocola sp.]|jgi:hypothetical protein|nr:hypothetical protein [Actinophytocola sp.]